MDLKLRTIVLLVTAVAFMMVVSVASFIQRTASDIEEALFFDVDVRALDVTTVQHTFYINPNQIKQFIFNNQTQHQILLYNGDAEPDNWGVDRGQFTMNNFDVQQVVYFRVFPTRMNVIPGVSRTEEYSLIPIALGGPPLNNVVGQPYIGRTVTAPHIARLGEPAIYSNNARANYRRYIDVSSSVAGGHYNLIHAFVVNAQLDEFDPVPADLQYRVSRWIHSNGSLTLTITPATSNTISWWNCPVCQGTVMGAHNHVHGLQARPPWLTHPRVSDMIQRW